MAYRTLEQTREGALTWLTLARPEVLNALDSVMVDELHDFLSALAADRGTRVVVIRGRPRLLRRARPQRTSPDRRRRARRGCACSGASASCPSV